MAGNLVYITVLLCTYHFAYAADLAQEKQNALAKISAHRKAVEQAFTVACDIFHNRPVYLFTVKNQKMELAQSLRELAAYEVNKIAEANTQKAKLLLVPKKVVDCIESRRLKSVDKVDTTFEKSFVKPIQDLLEEATNKRQDIINEWYSGYHYKLSIFDVQEDRAIMEINATQSKAYVQAALNHFERVANETLTHIQSFQDVLARSEAKFDRTLEKGLMNSFKASERKMVDDFLQTVNSCFVVV